jgi:hypothetical protein
MRRALALVAVALAAAVPAGAAAPHRSVPLGFFGTMVDGPLLAPGAPLSAEFSQMEATGVESVRAAVYWSQIQPYASAADVPAAQAASFTPVDGVPTDFSSFDAIVAAAAARGMSVLPAVVTAPAWARRDPTREWSPPADPSVYGRFVALLAQRYGPGGTFWAAHPGLRAMPIRAWQIWNEPAGFAVGQPSVFWDDPGESFEARYVAMLRAARTAVRAVDPGAKLVLAGLYGRNWETLADIYRHGAHGLFDEVAANVFTQQVANVSLDLALMHGVMSRAGDSRMPLIVSELTWPSARGRVERAAAMPYDVTPAGQAANLRAALPTIAALRVRLHIAGVYWYTWVTADARRDLDFDYAGLREQTPSGRIVAKPAQAAYAAVALRLEGR